MLLDRADRQDAGRHPRDEGGWQLHEGDARAEAARAQEVHRQRRLQPGDDGDPAELGAQLGQGNCQNERCGTNFFQPVTDGRVSKIKSQVATALDNFGHICFEKTDLHYETKDVFTFVTGYILPDLISMKLIYVQMTVTVT